MTTTEIIKQRIQSLLGEQYAVFGNEAFGRKFTNPVQTPYGDRYDVNYQAFNEYKDKIIAVVTASEAAQYNTPYRLFQGTYNVQFWVPLDIIKFNAMGQPLEAPKFTFFTNMAALKTALTAETYNVTDGSDTIKVYFTMGEPSLLSNTVDKSGAYDRVIYQVTGQVGLSHTNATTGENVRIAFYIDGANHYLDNYTNLDINPNTESATVVRQAEMQLNQEEAAFGYSISFDVDDHLDTTNKALTLIENKVFKNTDVGKVTVKIYKRSTLMNTFTAVFNASWSVSGKAGYGKYSVTLTDDGSKDDA
jgi:hypothetical protein